MITESFQIDAEVWENRFKRASIKFKGSLVNLQKNHFILLEPGDNTEKFWELFRNLTISKEFDAFLKKWNLTFGFDNKIRFMN